MSRPTDRLGKSKRGLGSQKITTRNPLVPVVRRKRMKVVDSAKAYRRKPKHPGKDVS